MADSLRLKQVLINLLSNAIKFTDCGSITLRVTLKQGLIYFAVIDTGMGISAKIITKLFKPFPQITSHHESTGLGLALSRKLAQLHGGDITVTSELNKGSCFTLSIPQYQ
ncbi:MAG: ATP-binding protein [Pleurocapsa sp.]